MTMRRYEAYKASGVEWLGELPSHWEAKPLKHCVRFTSGGTPNKEKLAYWDGSIPWASAKDLKTELILDTEDHLSELAIADGAASLVAAGSVLVLVRGMTLAKAFPVVLTAAPMAINQDLKALHVHAGLDAPFLAWTLRGLASESLARIDEAGHGTKALRMDAWTSLLLPLPPPSEQRAIAAFLDRETAKIDALVGEQRRLIDLLKEKRQALISHAVTKGLDPGAPMKDSGIEWLGEVPAHWEVRSIASVSTKITNGYVGPTRDILQPNGVRYLQSLHIKRNKIVFETPYYVDAQWSDQHEKSILREGDVLIVQTGDIGQVAVVPKEFVGCNCHALIIVSPIKTNLSGEWLAWVLTGDYGLHSLLSIQTGALHPHLNCGNVKELFVPVPPLDEQATIDGGLKSKTAEMDALIAEAEAAIALLQERRAALISAAVTGKIDVRDLVPAEQDAA